MRELWFGARRVDYYLRATEDIPVGRMLSHVKRPAHSVKLRRSTRLALAGVSVTAAKKGEGVWVRVEGGADVEVAK